MSFVSDPELLEHYKSRISHLMFENDAFNVALEQDEANFGILPDEFMNRMKEKDILRAKINHVFEHNQPIVHLVHQYTEDR